MHPSISLGSIPHEGRYALEEIMIKIGIAWILGDGTKDDEQSLKYLLVKWD